MSVKSNFIFTGGKITQPIIFPDGTIQSTAVVGSGVQTWQGGTVPNNVVADNGGSVYSELSTTGYVYTEGYTGSGDYGVLYSNGLELADGSGYIRISTVGIRFPDGTTQTTAGGGGSFNGGTITNDIIFNNSEIIYKYFNNDSESWEIDGIISKNGNYYGKGIYFDWSLNPSNNQGGSFAVNVDGTLGGGSTGDYDDWSWSLTKTGFYISGNNYFAIGDSGVTFPDNTVQTTAITNTIINYDNSGLTQSGNMQRTDYPLEIVVNIGGTDFYVPARLVNP